MARAPGNAARIALDAEFLSGVTDAAAVYRCAASKSVAMRVLRLLGTWWNRHRTGEKTGAILTLAAIAVGVYFGVHTMRSEDATSSGPAAPQSAPAPPSADSRPLSAATQCPQGKGLRAQTVQLACEIAAYCALREANAPASSDPSSQAYDEQTNREAVRRYLSRLTTTVAQLNARGVQSNQVDENALADGDQDCDSLNAFASATVQMASRLRS